MKEVYIEDIVRKLDKALSIKDITERQVVIESSVAISNNVSSKLNERVIKLERELYESSQYSRRECLELTGIYTNKHIQLRPGK